MIFRHAWLVLLITLTAAARLGADTVDTNLGPAGEMESEPGNAFRDTLSTGGEGPEMVIIPAGSFHMGCVSEQSCEGDELPVREVVIGRPFAMSKFEVTFEDYDRFTQLSEVDDEG